MPCAAPLRRAVDFILAICPYGTSRGNGEVDGGDEQEGEGVALIDNVGEGSGLNGRPRSSSGAGPSNWPSVGMSTVSPDMHISEADGNCLVRGVGCAIARSEVLQDRAYWEVTLLEAFGAGSLRVGVATLAHDLRRHLSCPALEPKSASTSWALQLSTQAEAPLAAGSGDNALRRCGCAVGESNSSATAPVDAVLAEGETIGCALDQTDAPATLQILHGGRELAVLRGLHGRLFPALSTSAAGTEVEVNFGNRPLRGPVPRGFDHCYAYEPEAERYVGGGRGAVL